jgi:hypothetical protein
MFEIKEFLEDLKNQFNGNAPDRDIMKLSVGTESLGDAEQQMVDSVRSSTVSRIGGLLREISSRNKDFVISSGLESFLANAHDMASLSTKDLQESALGIMSQKDVSKYKKDVNTIGGLDIHTLAQGLEKFDGQGLKPNLMVTIAHNITVVKQDSFLELFYPTILMENNKAGVEIATEVVEIYEGFERKNDGGIIDSSLGKRLITDYLLDPRGLARDDNKLVPAYIQDVNDKFFVPALQSVNTERGQEITTAPYKVGVECDVLALSQSAKDLELRTMDQTDALDRTINVSAFYFTLKTMADGNELVETFKYNLNGYGKRNFIDVNQGGTNDIALSFESDSIMVNTSTFKTVDGSDSQILSAFAANTLLALKLELNGKGNIETAKLRVRADETGLAKVTNASGTVLASTDPIFVAIAELVATMEVIGYDLEAYRTNSNLIDQGPMLTSTTRSDSFAIPVRSGMSSERPVIKADETNNDYNKVTSVALGSKLMKTGSGIAQFEKDIATLRTITDDGTTSPKSVFSLTDQIINPTYQSEVIDVMQYVDSQRSGERLEDIQSALAAKITDLIYDLERASRFNEALDLANMSGAGVVKIGLDDRIRKYINTSAIKLPEGFSLEVAYTRLTPFENAFYITFGTKVTNNTPIHLNWGYTFTMPEVVFEGTTPISGTGQKTILKTLPRYLHKGVCPVFFEGKFSGLEALVNKIPVYSQAV